MDAVMQEGGAPAGSMRREQAEGLENLPQGIATVKKPKEEERP